MIYFDNAATTNYKPQIVIDSVMDTITNYSFNPNRGQGKQQLILEQKILATRQVVSTMLGLHNESNVVFTSNCTTALNLAIMGTIKRRGHIVSSITEHNSVLRQLMYLKSRGVVDVSLLRPNKNGEITPEAVVSALKPNTYMVALCHTSNVTGKTQNLNAIFSAVKETKRNCITLTDCAQSVGYTPINMATDNIDMVAFPAHKGLHGIQGLGVLAFKDNAKPRPIVFGGTGTESENLLQPTTTPDGLEAGTLNCPAIVSLFHSISWWAENYIKNRDELTKMQTLLCDSLQSIKNVTVYSNYNKSGIVSFNIGNMDSGQISDKLSQYDIAVRSGLHCAPLMHKWLNTFDTGCVRASLSAGNTLDEVYKFLNVVESISTCIK